MQRIPTLGGHIAAESIGSGPAIIFLHGGPGDTHHYMKRMAEPLFSDFQCIFFDQRGTGESQVYDRKAENFQLEYLFEDLKAVQNHFRLQNPILVGHSWGAMYAIFAGIRFPDIFAKIALLSMGPLTPELGIETSENIMSAMSPLERQQWQSLREKRNAARDRGELEIVQQIDKELMKIRVQSWIYNPALREDFLIEYFQDPPPDREVNKWIWQGAETWFSWQDARKIKAPVLICEGANDTTPKTQAEKLSQLIPDCELQILQKCGHIPWLEHPEKFYQILEDFLT